MADASAQDRNLPASERKIRKAREDGQLPRSRDLGHLAAVGGGLALLSAAGPALAERLSALLKSGLRFDGSQLVAPAAMTERLAEVAWQLVALLGGIGGATAIVAIAGSLGAGGWNFTTKAFRIDLSRLSPIAGIGRMFSKQHFADVIKAIGLAAVVGIAGALYLRTHWGDFAEMLSMPLPAAASRVAAVLGAGLEVLIGVLAAAALVDVPLQRRLWLSRLKMTREEAKQEAKETEGSAEVKGRIKARMREMARRRMLTAVPKADLVVMNPTHFAVALKYDERTMAAPRVVAKGADGLALRIKEIAEQAKVPVLRAPPLARALHAHVEIDGEIPARLFAAVAQVLAFVYGLRTARAGGASIDDLPVIAVPPDLDPQHADAAAARDESPEDE